MAKRIEKLSKRQIDARFRKTILPVALTLRAEQTELSPKEYAKIYNMYVKNLYERGHISEEKMKLYLKRF